MRDSSSACASGWRLAELLRAFRRDGEFKVQMNSESSFPELIAARDLSGHLALKFDGSEGKPFERSLIEQRPLIGLTKALEPSKRLGLWRIAHRDGNINAKIIPRKFCRQQNHGGVIRPHPFRQRATSSKPAAHEFLAGIDGTLRVNRAPMAGTERTGMAAIDLVAGDFVAQPAIAASGATAATAGPTLVSIIVSRHAHSRNAQVYFCAFYSNLLI
jgi:hypothetical protein